MDNSVELNYLAKQKAMQEAGKVMENALKMAVDIFEKFQTDYSKLLEDNERLQSLVMKLQNNNGGCVERENNSTRREQVQSIKFKPVIVQDIIFKDDPKKIDKMESQGIIENTQIDKCILNKSKNRHLNKRENLQINIIHCDTNTNCENKKTKSPGISTSNTKSNSNKKFKISDVNAEITISTVSKNSQQINDILQPLDVEKNIHDNCDNRRRIDVEVDFEYLDVDTTLFDQPFSQGQMSNSKCKISGETKQDKTTAETLNEKSPERLSQDDVVETSPKKNMTRKINWLRRNKINNKSSAINTSRISNTVSNAVDNEELSCTPKTTKHVTVKENEEKNIMDKIQNPSTSRSQHTKVSLFSQRNLEQKESSILINNSTVSSSALPNSQKPVIPKSSTQVTIRNDKSDNNALKSMAGTLLTTKKSDETFFASDETYFPGYEQAHCSNIENNSSGILNKAKRKFEDMAKSSNIENEKKSTSPLMELDIGDMSDWEPDELGNESTPLVVQKQMIHTSFDMVPIKKEMTPKFATKGPVVRKKALREKLRGWDCENCAQYYGNMGLAEKDIEERKNLCSRHRSKFDERYNTPPGLWDLRFPDTQSSSQE